MTLRKLFILTALLLLPAGAYGQAIRPEHLQQSVVDNSAASCAPANLNDTWTCTIPGITAYQPRMTITIIPTTGNTTGATLDINSLGVKNVLTHSGATLSTGDIVATRPYTLTYDGTAWRMSGTTGGGSANISGLTADCIPKASSASALTADSSLCESASTVAVTKELRVTSDNCATPCWDVAVQKNRFLWTADAITQDGTNCAEPVTGQINGGPRTRWFLCADSAGSIFEGSARLTYAMSTASLTIMVNHGTTEAITFAGDFSAQCRATGTTVDSTWGTAVAADVSITTAHQPVQASATITGNGTCSAGSWFYWRYVVDAANFSPNAANTRILAVFLEQAS